MPDQARIGSISSGTLHTQDLLSAFATELEYLEGDDGQNAALIEEAYQIAARIAGGDDYDIEQANDVISELSDCLSDLAPPYCYFGANEGGGADFGFWPSVDAVNDLPRIDDPAEHPVNLAQEITAAMARGEYDSATTLTHKLADSDCIGGDCVFVNDHGNMTVYGADGSIIRDCV